MNDKLKAALDKAKNQWNKWSKAQKGIFGGVIALIVVAVIVLGTVSTRDGRVSLFNAPINDAQAFERIITRLEEENVPFTTTADGRIYVENSRVARRLKAVVVQEGLLPSNMDVWSFLNVNQFTVTDFEQKEKVRLAIAKDLEALLKTLDDVDNASVKIAMPETELFAEDNKPVTASVVITPSFSSDLVTNRAKIEGIERLVTRAIPRIDRENITITDNSGIELNSKNFQVVDRLHLTEAQLKIKQKAEKLLYEKVKRVLTNNGAGSAVIAAAMAGQALPWAFALKMLFTALTLGAGYKGGEIVPIFFTGATFGCAVAPLLGLPAPLGAALGMVALFCGCTNSPLASICLGLEVFGGQCLPLFALVCAVSYMLSSYFSLYHEQHFLHSKLQIGGVRFQEGRWTEAVPEEEN